jgi:hypothetical protein
MASWLEAVGAEHLEAHERWLRSAGQEGRPSPATCAKLTSRGCGSTQPTSTSAGVSSAFDGSGIALEEEMLRQWGVV